jgi:hypothetical protein
MFFDVVIVGSIRPPCKDTVPKTADRKLRGLSPNFYIHISVGDLYIPMIGLPILLQEKKVDRSWKYLTR